MNTLATERPPVKALGLCRELSHSWDSPKLEKVDLQEVNKLLEQLSIPPFFGQINWVIDRDHRKMLILEQKGELLFQAEVNCYVSYDEYLNLPVQVILSRFLLSKKGRGLKSLIKDKMTELRSPWAAIRKATVPVEELLGYMFALWENAAHGTDEIWEDLQNLQDKALDLFAQKDYEGFVSHTEQFIALLNTEQVNGGVFATVRITDDDFLALEWNGQWTLNRDVAVAIDLRGEKPPFVEYDTGTGKQSSFLGIENIVDINSTPMYWIVREGALSNVLAGELGVKQRVAALLLPPQELPSLPSIEGNNYVLWR